MTDKTGHADKPGAGPFDAQYVCSHGIPSGYYTYENQTGTFEAVKISLARRMCQSPMASQAEPMRCGGSKPTTNISSQFIDDYASPTS